MCVQTKKYLDGIMVDSKSKLTDTFNGSSENAIMLNISQGPVSSKRLRQNFVLEDVLGRFKDKNRVSSNSRNLGSSQILS